MFAEEMGWIARVRLEAEDGGDQAFYDELVGRVNRRKDQWQLSEEGGSFTPAELTRLIQSAHDLLLQIEDQRLARGK